MEGVYGEGRRGGICFHLGGWSGRVVGGWAELVEGRGLNVTILLCILKPQLFTLTAI